ncbi:hypothetical protein [uncultured Porphyromonas sp.]|uniref:terminase gpP N-terminus-related DNA-binding protein n=1 Tax=uncultured Porphyromonas sp. TaxID=159274 RepID=UPI00262C70FF|nr:hypothetical protein [uncultured Porphyromonas sp.]
MSTNTFSPRDPAKYDLARRLYMDKVPMKEIAKRVGTTPQTLSSWKRRGAWQEHRTAELLSPRRLYRKLLTQLDSLIEMGAPADTADAISKICKQIKELQHETTVDDIISVLSGFGDWLIQRGKELSTDTAFVQELTRLQDIYVQECLQRDNLLDTNDQ